MADAVADQLILASPLEAKEFAVERSIMRITEDRAHTVAFDTAGTALTLRMFEPRIRRAGYIQWRTHRHRTAHFTLHASACLAGIKLPRFAIPVGFAAVGAGRTALLDLRTLRTATTGKGRLMLVSTLQYGTSILRARDGRIRAGATRALVHVEMRARIVNRHA